MRIFVACLVFLPLTCLAADNDKPDLKSLYDTPQWFKLRDSVKKGNAAPFYRGAVACAFNELRRCEKKFRDVFKSAPRSDDAVEAHRVLASAYFIRGEYKKALAQVDAILALTPPEVVL